MTHDRPRTIKMFPPAPSVRVTPTTSPEAPRKRQSSDDLLSVAKRLPTNSRERRQLDPRTLMNRLYEEMILTDLTIRLEDGTELRTHRCVLAAFSPVFGRMLDNKNYKETLLGVVELKDVRADVMKAALRLMYGKPMGTVDTKTLMELLIVAERFEMVDLKELCESALDEDASIGSVDALDLLSLAYMHNASTLLRGALDRAARDTGILETLRSARGQDFILSHPQLVVRVMEKMQSYCSKCS